MSKPNTKKLEAMYAKLAGSLQTAHATDGRIRARAIAHHDALQTAIDAITPALQKTPLDLTKARAYGQMLKQKQTLTSIITKRHGRRRTADNESLV